MSPEETIEGKENLEERIDKVQPIKLIRTMKGAVNLLEREHIKLINTHGDIIGAYRKADDGGSDSTIIVFKDAKGFVEYIKTRAFSQPVVLRGNIAYTSYSEDESWDDGWSDCRTLVSDGLAFVDMPHIQAYFIPKD